MKKLILPLLLILGITMLVAVESAPSEVVGYVKYACSPGLNLIAMPLNNTYLTTEDLGNAYPAITSIQKWTGTGWYAVNYDPAWGWDDQFPLDDTSVLFVALESSADIFSLGPVQEPLPQFTFAVGLNTIYLPLNQSDITNTELLGTELPSISSIQKWTGDSWYAVNYDPAWGWDDQFDLSIGMPMFVAVDSATDPWPAAPRIGSTTLRNSK